MSENQALQFDRAEFASGATAATACAQCKQSIIQSYYEINGQLICSSCHEAIMQGADGSRVARIGRSVAAGLGAAIVGAVVWWGVRKLTGYEVGLISIGIGIGVGRAVRWGSRNRGGWAYQLLAVLLTYSAVAGNYMPDTFEALREQGTQEEVTAKATTTPAPAVTKASAVSAKVPAEEAVSFGALLVGLFGLFAIAAAVPFLQGASNIIGLLIIAFGLWEAWKLNRRVALTITGPFSMAAAPPPAPNV